MQPKKGRIIIYNAMDGKLKQVCEVSDSKGAVYSIKELNGKLIAGVNSKVKSHRNFDEIWQRIGVVWWRHTVAIVQVEW